MGRVLGVGVLAMVRIHLALKFAWQFSPEW
jgi:hypothetical protein